MKFVKPLFKKDLYLLLLIPLLFLPFLFWQAGVTVIMGLYLLILAVLFLPVFSRLRKWWLPSVLGLVILLPGPMDRMFLSVELTPEAGSNAFGIFSVIDILMLLTIFIKLNDEHDLKNFFNIRINYVTISLLAITFLACVSTLLSYLNYANFHFPMAFRAIFYSIRFLLVFAWINHFFGGLPEIRKLPVAVCLITLGFIFLVILSPKENYEGGNRLSVATYGVNTFGHLLAFISLFCIPFAVNYYAEKQKFPFFILAGCFLTCIVFLLMSANRMSFGLLVFGIGLYSLFYPAPFKKKLRVGLMFILMLAGALFSFSIVQPELMSRIFGVFDIVSGEQAIDNISELQSRFVVWGISLEMILEHPLFGAGPGQWNYLKHTFGSMPPWMSTILDPHNGYLLYASEMGLISMFIYYGIIIYSIYCGFKTFKRLKVAYRNGRSADNGFYMSFFLMLSLIICCWLLSDLTNASGLNIRVQSLMWSLCSILFISPSLSRKFIERNYEN